MKTATERKRFNNYLIFYIIMAAGLLLSWGQIGNSFKENKKQSDKFFDTRFLWPEEDCSLNETICAAFRKDFAMVAELVVSGSDKLSIKVKMAGEGNDLISHVKARVSLANDEYDDEFNQMYLAGLSSWNGSLLFPLEDDNKSKIEIRFKRDGQLFITEFPFNSGLLRKIPRG